MAIISGEQLTHALAGMPFPARRWQTMAWADFNCASKQTREALRHIPVKMYTTICEIMETLAEIEQREAAARSSGWRNPWDAAH